jgi:hypothetical protein
MPRLACSLGLVATGVGAQCLGMMSFADLTSVPADHPAPCTDQLRLAVGAYLARFTGPSRQHTESDLRCYLSWCAQRALDPLVARRPHLELYIRWIHAVSPVTSMGPPFGVFCHEHAGKRLRRRRGRAADIDRRLRGSQQEADQVAAREKTRAARQR